MADIISGVADAVEIRGGSLVSDPGDIHLKQKPKLKCRCKELL